MTLNKADYFSNVSMKTSMKTSEIFMSAGAGICMNKFKHEREII
jgi:hypothetical protein